MDVRVLHPFYSAPATRNGGVLEPSSLSLSAQRVEDVWIAIGLRRRWRVVSELRTFGEWDEQSEAVRFLELLVDGNPNLRRLD